MMGASGVAEPGQSLSLLDYRRRVADLYRQVRDMRGGEAAWHQWRRSRDELMRSHPQSPIPPEERATFRGLDYFPYDPKRRFELPLEPLAGGGPGELGHSGAGATGSRMVGFVVVPLGDEPAGLEVHWLRGYGGGLFLAFRDGTSGTETYGGGRYLLDTIKGADLGGTDGRLVVDFNFAYHPSCVYSSSWSCPLPPRQNRLTLPISAGEKLR